MRRRLTLLVACAVALATAVPAAADLRPVRRDFGELQVPRLRAGEVTIPSGHASGRIRVIVRLAQPPLAQYSATTTFAAGAKQRLSVTSAGSRAYLARLDAAQQAALTQLRRAIPEARVGRRFGILLNGITVDLPATRLPALVKQGFATKVYPSLRYALALNSSPGLIGAPALAAATGARGEGVKIAIVDDGVDQTNAFFSPAGFGYPAGYPKGATRWTTEKVIVAKSFPGPGAGEPGTLAVDPETSFHGTHVAGIAAGNAGTLAPPGQDHPSVAGLSGVAPAAWLGNYRVFTVPTPIGIVANTPEIVAAFEAAVADGMDVINFSGGGPETEPANDAMIETIRNVVAAGVVPVISAGNDRDEFGLGSAGSPGTAPDGISVAAVSNTQVFAQRLSVVAAGAPAGLAGIPFRPAGGTSTPVSWSTADQALVDVGAITGTSGTPVDRLLCAPSGDPNGAGNPLPRGSLTGSIALVSRGSCTFVSKAARAKAAGATGLVVVDNRPGEANFIPVPLDVPGGMVADLDGQRLRTQLAATGGRTTIRISTQLERIETGRSGIVTSFSSAGPTAFGHDLKPDVAAPGGQILSSTSAIAGGPFAVFDGTSMAAPHVAGAAALLVQRHPAWTPRQIKSALVSTAGPAWGDTARTTEAPVLLQGGGLIDVVRADSPSVFTEPASLSFDDLNANAAAATGSLLVRVSDAGDGAGVWQVELRPQAASPGATLLLPALVNLPPGGEAQLSVVAGAPAGATAGDNYGFIVLRKGDVTRRIPYYFAVTRPALESIEPIRLQRLQAGNTTTGGSRVSQYRFPAAPFGPSPTYTGAPMREDGAEKLYSIEITQPVANFGVSVVAASQNAAIDPWVLGSKDENDVQGYAGTPVNVNGLTLDYRVNIGAAGASTPTPGTYYVAVDSGRDPFTGRSLAGQYVLQSWVNDMYPPFVLPITTRVSTGRPTLAARVIDGPFGEPASGVDPLSLVIAYGRVLVGAAAYDPVSGLVVFPLPAAAPALKAGRTASIFVAADFQEAKNVNTSGADITPNTRYRNTSLQVVARPTVTWLNPIANQCAEATTRLLVTAGSTARVRQVRFFDGKRALATVKRGTAGLYFYDWKTRRAAKGKHMLRAVVTDAKGKKAEALLGARICR